MFIHVIITSSLNISWEILGKLEYLSYYLAIPAFAQFFCSIFDQKFLKTKKVKLDTLNNNNEKNVDILDMLNSHRESTVHLDEMKDKVASSINLINFGHSLFTDLPFTIK